MSPFMLPVALGELGDVAVFVLDPKFAAGIGGDGCHGIDRVTYFG